MLEDAEHEVWEAQHYDPKIFKTDPGGIVYQREGEGRVWGILREVVEKEMVSWDSRDYHKHHLSVVLVKNTYCPLLSNCCGDSLDIEMKRSLPEMRKGISKK